MTTPSTPTLTELIIAALESYGPALAITPVEAVAETVAEYITHSADSALAVVHGADPLDYYDWDIAHGLTNLMRTALETAYDRWQETGTPPAITHHLGHHLTSRYHLVPRRPDTEEEDEDR